MSSAGKDKHSAERGVHSVSESQAGTRGIVCRNRPGNTIDE